jgi:DHA2 family multidrug resistance protein
VSNGRQGVSPYVIAMVVMLTTFMEVLDTSVANVALPHIAGSLSATLDESTWVLTSYLVANAVVLPMSGWFSSLLGRKRFYLTCVLVFTVSSFLCAVAPTLGWLIFFRILQGLGGGGLQPTSQSILMESFPPEKRGQARCWAAGSRTTSAGTGSSSSTSRWARCPWCCPAPSWWIRPTSSG